MSFSMNEEDVPKDDSHLKAAGYDEGMADEECEEAEVAAAVSHVKSNNSYNASSSSAAPQQPAATNNNNDIVADEEQEEREEPVAATPSASTVVSPQEEKRNSVAPLAANVIADEEQEEREEPIPAAKDDNTAIAAGRSTNDVVADEEQEEATGAAPQDRSINVTANNDVPADEEREEAANDLPADEEHEEPFKNDDNAAASPDASGVEASNNNGDHVADEELPERDDDDSNSTVSDDSNASSNGGNKDPAIVAAMLAEGEALRFQQEEADRVAIENSNKREAAIAAPTSDTAARDEEAEEHEEADHHPVDDNANSTNTQQQPTMSDAGITEMKRKENQLRQLEILRALGGAPNNFFGVDVTSLRLSRFIPPPHSLMVDEDDEMSGDDDETLSRKRRNRKRKIKMGGGGVKSTSTTSQQQSKLSTTTIDGRDLAALFPQSVQEEIDIIIAALRDTENAIMGRGGATSTTPTPATSPAPDGTTPPRRGSPTTTRPTSGGSVAAGAFDAGESQFVYRQLYSALSAPIAISDPRVLLGLDEGFFGKLNGQNGGAEDVDENGQLINMNDDAQSTTTSHIMNRLTMDRRVDLARLIYEGKLPASVADGQQQEEEEFYCCGKDATKTHNQSRVILKIQNNNTGGGDSPAVLLLLDTRGGEMNVPGSEDSKIVAGKVPAKEEFVSWRRWTELNPQACVFGNGGQNYSAGANNNNAQQATAAAGGDEKRVEMTLEELQRQYRRETEITFEHIPPMPPGEGIVSTICVHHLPPLPTLPKVYTERFTSTLEKSRKLYAKEIAAKEAAAAAAKKETPTTTNDDDDKPLSHSTSNNNNVDANAAPVSSSSAPKRKKETLYGPGTFQPSFLPSILDDHFFLLGLVACLNSHPPQLPELQPEGEDEEDVSGGGGGSMSINNNRRSSPDGLNDDTLRGAANNNTNNDDTTTPVSSSPYGFFNQVFASLEHIDRGLFTVRAYADEELDLKPYLAKSNDLEGPPIGGAAKAKRATNPKSKSMRKRQQQDAEREKDPNYFRLTVPLPVYITMDTMLPAGTAAYSVAGTIEAELERNPSRAAQYRYNRSLPPADIDHIVGRTYEDGTECWAPLLAKAYATLKQRQYLRDFTTGEKPIDAHLRDLRRDSPAFNFNQGGDGTSATSKLFQYLGGYAALHGGSAPDVIKTFMNPDEAVFIQWNNKPVAQYYNTSFYEAAPPVEINPEIQGSVSADSATLGRARAATEREEKKMVLRGLAAAARTTQGFAKDQLWWMLRQATDAHQPTMLTNIELCSNSVGATVTSDPSRIANGIPPCSFGTVPSPIDGYLDEASLGLSPAGTPRMHNRPPSGKAEAFDEAAGSVGALPSHTFRPNSAGNVSTASSAIGRLKHPDYRIRYNAYSTSELALGKVPDGGSTSEKSVGNISMTGSMMGFGGNRSMSMMSTGSLANLNGSLGGDSNGGGGVGGNQPPLPTFNWDYGVVVLSAVEVNLDADSTIVDPYARAMIKKRRKLERANLRRKERIAQGEDPNSIDDENNNDAEDQAADEEDEGLVRLVKVRSVYRTNHPNYSKLRGEWSIPGGGGRPHDDDDITEDSNHNSSVNDDAATHGNTINLNDKKANAGPPSPPKKKDASSTKKNGHWSPYLQEQLQYSVDVVREQQSENLVWWMSMDELHEHFNYMYTGMNATSFSTQSLVPFYSPEGQTSKKHQLSMPHCPYTVTPPRLQQAIDILKQREAAALKREKEDAFKGRNATLNKGSLHTASSAASGGRRGSRKASSTAAVAAAAATAAAAGRKASTTTDAAAASTNSNANAAADGHDDTAANNRASSTESDAVAKTAGNSNIKPVEYESPTLLLSLLEGAQYFNVFAGLDEDEVERIQQSLPAPTASKTANPALSQEQQAEREDEEERDNYNNHNSGVISKMVQVIESPGASYAAPFYPHFLLTVDKVNTGKVDESAGLAAIAGFDFTGANGGPNLLRYESIFDVKPGPIVMGTQLKIVKKRNPKTGEEEESEDWTETDDESNAMGQSTTTTATTTATNLAAAAASQSALQLKFTLKMPIPPGISAAAKACAPPQISKSGKKSASASATSARSRRMRNTMASGVFSSGAAGGFDNGSFASYRSTSTTAANAAAQAQFPTDFVVQLFRVPTAVRQACVRTLVPAGGPSAQSPQSPGIEAGSLDFPGVDVLDTESVIANDQAQQAAVKPVYNLPAHTQVNVRPSIVKREKTEKQKEKERKDRQASLSSGKPLTPAPPAATQEEEDISPTIALMTAAELVDGERFFRATFEAEVNTGLYNIVIAPAANDPHTRNSGDHLQSNTSAPPPPVTSVNTCLNMPTFAHITVEKAGKNRRGYKCGVFHLPK